MSKANKNEGQPSTVNEQQNKGHKFYDVDSVISTMNCSGFIGESMI